MKGAAHHRRDPAASVSDAVALLCRAARKASDLGQLLEDAQAAISEQGYHADPEADSSPRLPGTW